MPKSVEKTDWLGDKYVEHYDDNGKKIGESREKSDWLGDKYTEHRDTNGKKIGESREKADWLGDRYTKTDGAIPPFRTMSSSSHDTSREISSSGSMSSKVGASSNWVVWLVVLLLLLLCVLYTVLACMIASLLALISPSGGSPFY